MEKRVARILARTVTRHERWKRGRLRHFVGPATLVAGFVMLIVGIIILPTPAPGWLLIFTSVAILSLELRRVRGFVLMAARRFDDAEDWFRGRHPALQAVLTLAVVAFMIAAMGSAWYFVAPDGLPLTNGAATGAVAAAA
ncbi:TIGR02611 family protein [Corynebacterium sp. 335C]